jgi:hypothetical protein
MWARLVVDILPYRDYKMLTSACNFSSYSIEEPRDLSNWNDVILRILDDILEDEETLADLALIVFPIIIVFIIYLWYRNLNSKINIRP